MSSRLMRLCLLALSGGLLLLGLAFLEGLTSPQPAAAYAPSHADEALPNASFHLWEVNEIFTCSDGSAQFIELFTTSNGQQFLNGNQLRAANDDDGQTRSFVFPSDSPAPTADKFLLIATSGFAALPGGITPDFILPSNFIFTTGGAGSVTLVGASTPALNYGDGELPLDGIQSWNQGNPNFAATNSPQNFAGEIGSVFCSPKPDLTLTKTAAAASIVEGGKLLTYTLAVANKGLVAVTNTLITDAIPLNTVYVPNSASDGGIFGSNIISWTNLTIDHGVTLTRTFQVTVGAILTTGDKIINTAYVSTDEKELAVDSVTVTVGQTVNNGTTLYLPLILKNE